MIYKRYVKRIMDLIISLLLIVILMPVFLAITLLLLIENRGYPFFIQKRPGRNGKIFTLIKFRTMNDKRDARGMLLPDVERFTRTGRLLRKTSLDELPQLWNVMIGDMSLVGPRPLLVEYLSLYNSFQQRRHEVRPGITGWAQVNGRNTLSWDQKFAYDVWYADHVSLPTDLRIIWLTIRKVLTGMDVNASDVITMEKFTGNPD